MVASSTKPRSEAAPPQRRRRSIDRFDVGVLVALSAVSVVFIGALLIHGGTLTGIEGFVGADQGQYLAWIRQGSEHFLIANRFDFEPDSHVWIQPGVAASAALHLLGVSVPLAYLAWKPVAVAVLFWGTWRYVGRMLQGLWERRAALVIALFFVPPAAALGGFGTPTDRANLDFIAGEAWTAGHLWGYPLSAVVCGLTPLVFIWVERAVTMVGTSESRRSLAFASGGALLISWLHPWQGSILLGTIALAGLWQAFSGSQPPLRLLRSLLPPFVAGALPLAYVAILSRVDESWELTYDVYQRVSLWPTSLLILALAPLAVPALLGYRGRPDDYQERVLRLWPLVGVLVYVAPFTSFPFHAFTGLALPLAILAVRGVSRGFHDAWHAAPSGNRWGRPFLAGVAVLAVAVLVVPGVVDRLRAVRTAVRANFEPYRYAPGERAALTALDQDPRPGGVLATPRLGQFVPFETDRETWAGTISWTPDFGARMNATRQLFAGELSASAARRLVHSSRARFVFADCTARGPLGRQLAPLVGETRRYGCATVYVLRDKA